MTDYIEEMMKTAGIKPKRPCDSCDNCDGTLYSCGELPESYPDFTPEKQQDIFLLIQQADFIDFIQCFVYEPEKIYVLRALTVCELSSENPFVYIGKHKDYPQALAQLTTELMKAGELDKQKVKEILEK